MGRFRLRCPQRWPLVELLLRETADLYLERKALWTEKMARAVDFMRERVRARMVEKWQKLLDHRTMKDSHEVIKAV